MNPRVGNVSATLPNRSNNNIITSIANQIELNLKKKRKTPFLLSTNSSYIILCTTLPFIDLIIIYKTFVSYKTIQFHGKIVRIFISGASVSMSSNCNVYFWYVLRFSPLEEQKNVFYSLKNPKFLQTTSHPPTN